MTDKQKLIDEIKYLRNRMELLRIWSSMNEVSNLEKFAIDSLSHIDKKLIEKIYK